MNSTFIVGVMGGASARRRTRDDAYRLGALIAGQGWVLLNGGRAAGVMDASARGASDHGGTTVGILPGGDRSDASAHIQIPICTGMGSARNTINVLSCDVVVACPGGAGTLSEIALALKHEKPVIIMGQDMTLDSSHLKDHRLMHVGNAEEAVALIRERFFTETHED